MSFSSSVSLFFCVFQSLSLRPLEGISSLRHPPTHSLCISPCLLPCCCPGFVRSKIVATRLNLEYGQAEMDGFTHPMFRRDRHDLIRDIVRSSPALRTGSGRSVGERANIRRTEARTLLPLRANSDSQAAVESVRVRAYSECESGQSDRPSFARSATSSSDIPDFRQKLSLSVQEDSPSDHSAPAFTTEEEITTTATTSTAHMYAPPSPSHSEWILTGQQSEWRPSPLRTIHSHPHNSQHDRSADMAELLYDERLDASHTALDTLFQHIQASHFGADRLQVLIVLLFVLSLIASETGFSVDDPILLSLDFGLNCL
eukprot:m.278191 g.278191  ORF g.278191 m.278191 type:complete len:315 (-) comp54882_c0_seq11:694-1638(-)